MAFENITSEQHAAFLTSLKSGQYNLLLGAGSSMDSSNAKGNLPGGNALRDDLCKLKGAKPNQSLQRVFALLDAPEVKEHVTERFVNCTPGPTLLSLSSFIWKRAFTFNIDDAMEAAYEKPEAKQELTPIHFKDDYEDAGTLAQLFLVHLHGFVGFPDRGYVFSRDEYLQQIMKINPWMTVLSQFIGTEPFIIVGSSMDEVDLDFYIAHRKSTSGRDDRGPSIFIEPTPDSITRNECERHGLVLFEGKSIDFFNYCNNAAPNRPTPYELIPAESQKIIPDIVTKRAALAFWTDFELVPGTGENSPEVSRFMYGHPPSWRDLASELDVSRTVSGEIIGDIEKRLNDTAENRRLVLLMSITGAGKTTVLRRCAFELAKRGITTLRCTASSRLLPAATADIIDLMDDPIVIVADNFADQVPAFSDILDRLEKRDVVILAAERSYRSRYIKQALSGIEFQLFGDLKLRQIDVSRMIDKYIQFGLVGSKGAIKNREHFTQLLVPDPIAIACCRILNDFRPLDRIIAEIFEYCDSGQRNRYLISALAQHCFSGGIRYAVLASAVGSDGLKDQIRTDHPLPLAFSSDLSNSFVVPQNATLASRILSQASHNDRERLFNVFVALANGIAPRVNLTAIRHRSPEARLAGRLFDFDSVTEVFLQEYAFKFYEATQAAWQWNSRYWEQVALLKLSIFQRAPDTQKGLEALEMAVQHARHSVSIEFHPFSLTTLGKTLLAQMTIDEFPLTLTYAEAFEKLDAAIRLERKRARVSLHPFITLFSGSRNFLERGGELSSGQYDLLRTLMDDAGRKFPRDMEVHEAVDALQAIME